MLALDYLSLNPNMGLPSLMIMTMERVRRQSLLVETEADLTAVDPESDDDFDETTLWEIANLLNTRNVPSRDSLLPSGRAEIIEDYDETDTELEDTESVSFVGNRHRTLNYWRISFKNLTMIFKVLTDVWKESHTP